MASNSSQLHSAPNLCNSSKLRKVSFIYHWKIERFANFMDRKYEIPSQKFVPDEKDGTEWKLVLFTKHIYPKGSYLAVNLVKLSDDGKSHGINYSISLISDYSVHHFKRSGEKTFKHFLDFEECVIATYDELSNEKMILFERRPDLLLRCEIDMLIVENETERGISKRTNLISNNLGSSKLPSAADNYVNIKCENDFSYSPDNFKNGPQEMSNTMDSLNSLSDDFCSLYENKNFTDIALVCEGISMRAHKAVLAARSEIFRSGKIRDHVKISGVKYDVMEAMLYYMYTGKTRQLTADMAVDMLYAAKKFKLEELRNLLLDFLKSNMKNVPQLAEELEEDITKLVELNFCN